MPPDGCLSTSLIGKLVLRGDPDWCSVLFSTNPLVKALLTFKGQGCINQGYKAGSWTKSAEDKVLQMLKDTLEKEEGEKGSETKHKRTTQSKKRQRTSKAAVDTMVDAALRDGGQRLSWMIAWRVSTKMEQAETTQPQSDVAGAPVGYAIEEQLPPAQIDDALVDMRDYDLASATRKALRH